MAFQEYFYFFSCGNSCACTIHWHEREKGKESGQKSGKGSKEQSKFSDVRLSHKNINVHNLVLYWHTHIYNFTHIMFLSAFYSNLTLALLCTMFCFMKIKCENLQISQNNNNFMACQGYFLLLFFNLDHVIIVNICILGLNHLVKLKCTFNFIYMTYDLMLENNNTIVVLIENCELRARRNHWSDCSGSQGKGFIPTPAVGP